MVQSVEQGCHRSQYPGRERHQRLRLHAGGKNQRNLRRVIFFLRKQSSDNERRPPAAKIQPELDFSCRALGGGAADSWNSFLLVPFTPPPYRFTALSSHP